MYGGVLYPVFFLIQALNNKLLKTKDRRSRGDIRRELRHLAKEERQRQQQAVSDVIKDSSVVLTTLTGSLSYQLQEVDFDVVIIDEAAQALEVACWMAILKVGNKRFESRSTEIQNLLLVIIHALFDSSGISVHFSW